MNCWLIKIINVNTSEITHLNLFKKSRIINEGENKKEGKEGNHSHDRLFKSARDSS